MFTDDVDRAFLTQTRLNIDIQSTWMFNFESRYVLSSQITISFVKPGNLWTASHIAYLLLGQCNQGTHSVMTHYHRVGRQSCSLADTVKFSDENSL